MSRDRKTTTRRPPAAAAATGTDNANASQEDLLRQIVHHLRRNGEKGDALIADFSRRFNEFTEGNATVQPEVEYVEKLCAAAKKEQVNLSIDLRAGTIRIVAPQSYDFGTRQ